MRTRAFRGAMRGMSRWVLPVLVLLSAALIVPVADGEEEGPFECPIRALLAEDDAGLLRVYDGIRKGLEQAQLPRVCREDLGEDGEEVLDRLEADPPPLVFVLGRRAADRLGTRLATVPRVYVDTAWFVKGEALPPAPMPKPPAAVVRSVTKAVRVAEVLRAIESGRPRGLLSWEATGAALARAADRLALAAGFRRVGDESEADVLLHLRLGVGDQPAPLSDLLERARRRGILLLSDDLGHWRKGAVVLILPDHFLLGRVAAEAGRRLLLADEPRVERRTVGASEIRVDLRAARALGLDLPVPFLAGVDVLRGAPRRAPTEEPR